MPQDWRKKFVWKCKSWLINLMSYITHILLFHSIFHMTMNLKLWTIQTWSWKDRMELSCWLCMLSTTDWCLVPCRSKMLSTTSETGSQELHSVAQKYWTNDVHIRYSKVHKTVQTLKCKTFHLRLRSWFLEFLFLAPTPIPNNCMYVPNTL